MVLGRVVWERVLGSFLQLDEFWWELHPPLERVRRGDRQTWWTTHNPKQAGGDGLKSIQAAVLSIVHVLADVVCPFTLVYNSRN